MMSGNECPFCLFNEVQYPFLPKINNKKYVHYMYAKKKYVFKMIDRFCLYSI